MNRYEDAHEEWVKSLEYAKQIADKTQNLENYHLVLSNLLLSYSVHPNHLASNRILDEMEQAFSSNIHRLGIVYYARAKKAEYEGNIGKAKTHAIRSLEFFRNTVACMAIGKAEVTVAHFEYLEGNYLASKKLLEDAIKNLSDYNREWLIAIKEYAKTLLKLQEFHQMEKIVIDSLKQAQSFSSKYRDIVGKLHLLLSMCKNETSHAESVLFDNLVHVNVRILAYQFLKRYCIQNGDKDTLMKYAIIEDELGAIKKDLLNEEML